MKEINNIFGKGKIYSIEDLEGKIYATSSACMSVWSDFLSWANANMDRIEKNPKKADNIVVLGCQVTDLSIYNDIEVAYRLYKETGKEVYMGGCLAQRLDIELPSFIRRLDVVRTIGQEINDRNLIDYEPPYWVPDYEESKDDFKDGNLFRNYYPLKIGAGCHGACKYCTIKHTRGDSYATVPENQIEEFLNHEDVVLISDSPTVTQIKDWCAIAKRLEKDISVRNIEPQTLVACEEEIIDLASSGYLRILHCPIQSFDAQVLKAMNRSVTMTEKALEIMQIVRNLGVKVATNIIIDYEVDGKLIPNHDQKRLIKEFDYYSWNPYFDGNFNMDKAKERFKKYIGEKK